VRIYRRRQKKPKPKPLDRILRSVRRECLDWFIIVGERQLRKLLEEYVYYYNEQRPHQGIGEEIPRGENGGETERSFSVPRKGI